jgi:ketosteroid isomerase-like protein
MSRRVFLVVAVASLGSTASLSAQGPTLSARSESVRAAEMARRDALLASDTVALSKLVAGEFIEISRLGTVRSRADNMREVASGDLKLLTIKYDSLDVRIYGDVALLTGIADNTGMYRGTVPFSGKIRYTRVFVWRDGRWQAVSMQQTPMA